jgi:hypothetical protein
MLLTGEQAAGVYQIKTVRHKQLTEDLSIQRVERDFTLNDVLYKPDIIKADEAVYSAYQQYIVEFIDPVMNRFNENIPDHETYDATVTYIPGIQPLQEWVSDEGNRSIYGDIVVKAVLPAFISVSFTAKYKRGQEPTDTYLLQSIVAATIRNLGITNGLAASVLYDCLQEQLPTGAHIENLIMKSELQLPNNELHSSDKVVTNVSREFLKLYYPPYATEKTIALFCEPEDVAVVTEFMD